jgi:hypothetical protein
MQSNSTVPENQDNVIQRKIQFQDTILRWCMLLMLLPPHQLHFRVGDDSELLMKGREVVRYYPLWICIKLECSSWL